MADQPLLYLRMHDHIALNVSEATQQALIWYTEKVTDISQLSKPMIKSQRLTRKIVQLTFIFNDHHIYLTLAYHEQDKQEACN